MLNLTAVLAFIKKDIDSLLFLFRSFNFFIKYPLDGSAID